MYTSPSHWFQVDKSGDRFPQGVRFKKSKQATCLHFCFPKLPQTLVTLCIRKPSICTRIQYSHRQKELTGSYSGSL